MLPGLHHRRFSNRSSSPQTPIFYQPSGISALSSNRKSSLNSYKDRSFLVSTICKDALEIKALNKRIAKLSKDNDLLKSFILSTNIKNFSQNSKDFESLVEMKKEFERLETHLTNLN